MKYDRPVWQLMHACADELPETFRFTDVRDWFADNFPDVGDSTMRAHLVGLTEGGAEKQNQFRQRAPLFRRVSRGVYSVIPIAERGESPHDRETSESDEVSHVPAQERQSDARHEPVQLTGHTATPGSSAVAPALDSIAGTDMTVEPKATVVTKRVAAIKRWRASRRARRQAETESRGSYGSVVSPNEAEKLHSAQPSTEPHLRVVPPSTASDADNLEIGEATMRNFGPSDSQISRHVDAVLVGTGRDPVVVPVPAKNAFRDRTFLRDRRAAERSGAPWFLITAGRGLLRPDEWVTPDDETDGRGSTDERKWAQTVAAKLASAIGPLSGRSLHVSADDSLASTVIDVLSSEGARVSRGPVPVPTEPSEPGPVRVETQPEPSAIDAIVQALADSQQAIAASAARGLPERPGLYAWLIDESGAATLSESLQLTVGAGPLYVGQAGAYEGFGEVSASLNDHINLVQLYGSSRRSAFRSHLATALAEPLNLRTIDDARLTRWMVDHLSVTCWPAEDVISLPDLKAQVLAKLHAPLNFERTNSGVFYERMTALRARLA